MVCNSSWDISSENFVKHNFVKITLNKNKVLSSIQIFHLVKTAFFARYKGMTFNCLTEDYAKINSPKEILDLIFKKSWARGILGQTTQSTNEHLTMLPNG